MNPNTPIQDLWKYDLRKGKTDHPRNGACLFDAGMWLVYGRIGDDPPCSCPVIRAYAVGLNDRMDDAARQLLKPFILRVVGNRDPAAEPARRMHIIAETARRVVPLGVRPGPRRRDAGAPRRLCRDPRVDAPGTSLRPRRLLRRPRPHCSPRRHRRRPRRRFLRLPRYRRRPRRRFLRLRCCLARSYKHPGRCLAYRQTVTGVRPRRRPRRGRRVRAGPDMTPRPDRRRPRRPSRGPRFGWLNQESSTDHENRAFLMEALR